MTATKKGWNRAIMCSLFHKEATYDAGHAMADANACSLTGYELDTIWDDVVINDKSEVTGKEHGYDQEIVETRYRATLRFPKVKPNDLAGFASYGLGSSTPSQDGAHTAYKHKIVPQTVGTVLNSMQVEELFGGLQYYYRGVKVNTIKLSGEAGGLLAMEVGLIGSGTRATSATAMAAAITESWMKLHDCKVWFETGAAISIEATLRQDTEDLSSATPDNLYPRLRSFEWTWDNGLIGQPGFGGAGVLQDIDYARRKCGLKFQLQFYDTTELDYYTSQAACAIEFDLKGAVVETSDFYYGCHLVVPRFKLKAAPLPKGGPNDTLIADYDCEVFDDGTNAATIIEVYNAQAAYQG
jgi:hypothetical protein